MQNLYCILNFVQTIAEWRFISNMNETVMKCFICNVILINIFKNILFSKYLITWRNNDFLRIWTYDRHEILGIKIASLIFLTEFV